MSTGEENPHSHLKIAIVDDSEFSCHTISKILEEAGFHVACTAPNAEEGFNMGMATEANLYIIDILMPETSGLEMAKVISENSSKTKIIMTSPLNKEQLIIESLTHGAIDFLSCPLSPRELIKAVKKVEMEMEQE